MRNYFFLFLAITSFNVARGQRSGFTPVADAAGFTGQFATASQRTQSIKADFIQEKNLSMLSEKIISKGKFWYKKENLVRMEYKEPFQYLLILSANSVYIKDGDKENKISTRSSKLFRQVDRVIIDCVKGTALLSPEFKVHIYESPKAYLVELLPLDKNIATLFRQINLLLDKKDYTASRIELLEQSGDHTEITFTNKELNPEIPDAIFAVH